MPQDLKQGYASWSKDILDTIWKVTLWSLWKCEIDVGEYNTLDLVKDNTIIFEMQEKGHNAFLQPRRNLDFGH